MSRFAERYYACNRRKSAVENDAKKDEKDDTSRDTNKKEVDTNKKEDERGFDSEETVAILTTAVIMLNTDLHNINNPFKMR